MTLPCGRSAMRIASEPEPTPVIVTGRLQTFAATSSEARMQTAAPSDIVQMSSIVSGVAAIGDSRTCLIVSRLAFWAYGLYSAFMWFLTDTIAICSTVVQMAMEIGRAHV